MKPDRPPRFRRVDSFQSEPFEDELLVLQPGTRQVFQLNAVAAVLWDALEWPQSNADLFALLREAFPSEAPAVLDGHVKSFLASLLEGRLIEQV